MIINLIPFNFKLVVVLKMHQIITIIIIVITTTTTTTTATTHSLKKRKEEGNVGGKIKLWLVSTFQLSWRL